MATTKITSNLITDDAVTGGKLNPAFVQGDIMYASGTDTIARLAKGSADEVLTMNTGATAPEWAAAAGGGKVLQVISSAETTQHSHNGSSYAATDFTSSAITPASTGSSIIVMGTCCCGGDGGTGNYEERAWQWYRDIGGAGYAAIGAEFGWQISINGYTTAGAAWPLTFIAHDSPSTTSACTYKLYSKSDEGTTTYTNYTAMSGVDGQIILIEIGA